MRKVSLSIVLCVLAGGCVYDPVIPHAAVTTLDESGTHGFIAVSVGLEHSCGLTIGGSAHCWGSHEYGQLGAPSDTICARDDLSIPCRLRPVIVSGGLTFQKISAGGRITCGLTQSGAIYCWGDNLHGGLGDPAYRSSEVPIRIASTAMFIDVTAGGQHACGIRSDGVALCWGANENSQLGVGSLGSSVAVPTAVNTNLRFASISAGARRTCARQSDGASYCWGATWVITVDRDDTMRSQTTPLRVQSNAATQFTSITPGTNTTCALTADNRGFCWESNVLGTIGDGTIDGSQTPKPAGGDLRFIALASGGQHTCGIEVTGKAWCWGTDPRGQLGISSVFLTLRCGASRLVCSTTPVPVSGFRRFTQIAVGQGDHSCGLTIGGNVFCWGAASMGQRGDGRAISSDWSPVRTLAPAAM